MDTNEQNDFTSLSALIKGVFPDGKINDTVESRQQLRDSIHAHFHINKKMEELDRTIHFPANQDDLILRIVHNADEMTTSVWSLREQKALVIKEDGAFEKSISMIERMALSSAVILALKDIGTPAATAIKDNKDIVHGKLPERAKPV